MAAGDKSIVLTDKNVKTINGESVLGSGDIVINNAIEFGRYLDTSIDVSYTSSTNTFSSNTIILPNGNEFVYSANGGFCFVYNPLTKQKGATVQYTLNTTYAIQPTTKNITGVFLPDGRLFLYRLGTDSITTEWIDEITVFSFNGVEVTVDATLSSVRQACLAVGSFTMEVLKDYVVISGTTRSTIVADDANLVFAVRVTGNVITVGQQYTVGTYYSFTCLPICPISQNEFGLLQNSANNVYTPYYLRVNTDLTISLLATGSTFSASNGSVSLLGGGKHPSGTYLVHTGSLGKIVPISFGTPIKVGTQSTNTFYYQRSKILDNGIVLVYAAQTNSTTSVIRVYAFYELNGTWIESVVSSLSTYFNFAYISGNSVIAAYIGSGTNNGVFKFTPTLLNNEIVFTSERLSSSTVIFGISGATNPSIFEEYTASGGATVYTFGRNQILADGDKFDFVYSGDSLGFNFDGQNSKLSLNEMYPYTSLNVNVPVENRKSYWGIFYNVGLNTYRINRITLK